MTEDPRIFQLFTEVGIIDQLAGNAFERAMPKGMTRAQFTVLHHLVRLDLKDQSPAQLANAIQVTRPTMTSTLSRMAKAGLVTIRPDPSDGRAKLVSLTQAGRDMRDRCIAAVAPLLPVAETALNDAEVIHALDLLRRLRIVLDRARD